MKLISFVSMLLAAFLFSLINLFSMDWPSPSVLVVKNFGWNDNGMPHLGVTFEDGLEIRAAETGESPLSAAL